MAIAHTRRIALLVAAVVATTNTARAQQSAAARKQTPAAAPGTPQSAPAGPSVSLTIDEAVKMALDKNLDIAVQRLNPQMYDLSLASVKAAYLPTFPSLFGDQHQTAVPVSLLTGGQQ